uniref:Endonuclease/exonuclease/phosphatase family protein n=1 Tax=Borely moumouvirus TaxID=2712067 RepID=A0A6G6ACH4_9VIRU
MTHKNKAVLITDKVVPASPLDNVLKFKNFNEIQVELYDFYQGNLLTPENRKNFYEVVVQNAINKNYPTIDHLITCVKIGEVNFLYVSLDNSVRANMNGYPLYKRLDAICQVLNNIINKLDKCIVYFSESCRYSFLGDRDKRENITSWLSIRDMISERCNLQFIIEKRNNDDSSDMSFGISVFCTDSVKKYIQTYFVKSILLEAFGSVAVGIKLKTGQIIWGIHFPLDFRTEGENNPGFKTMVNLQYLMEEYSGSVCAFGDFNTVPGNISYSINKAIKPDFEFMLVEELTFFGTYFDTIPIDNNDVRISILDF